MSSDIRTIRLWIAAQAALFGVAALVHSGAIGGASPHVRAGLAELVIAAVLLGGLIGSIAVPAHAATIALVAQGFAVAGTLIGVVMVAIGLGPNLPLDYVLHAAMLVLLLLGIRHTRRHMRWKRRRQGAGGDWP